MRKSPKQVERTEVKIAYVRTTPEYMQHFHDTDKMVLLLDSSLIKEFCVGQDCGKVCNSITEKYDVRRYLSRGNYCAKCATKCYKDAKRTHYSEKELNLYFNHPDPQELYEETYA